MTYYEKKIITRGTMFCAPFATAATEYGHVCGKKVDCRVHVYIQADRRQTDIRTYAKEVSWVTFVVLLCMQGGGETCSTSSKLSDASSMSADGSRETKREEVLL